MGIGKIYFKISNYDKSGNLISEEFNTIPNNMYKNDSVNFELKLSEKSMINTKICLVQFGIKDFPLCSNGSTVEIDNLSEYLQPIIKDKKILFSDSRILLKGWSGFEKDFVWSLGKSSEIIFKVDDLSIKEFNIDLVTLGEQNLKIFLNGEKLYEKKLNNQLINLDLKNLKMGKNTLLFEHPDARIPNEQDNRLIAIALKSIEVK